MLTWFRGNILLISICGMMASPFCVTRDSISAFDHLARDDVVVRRYRERVQKSPPEECYEVVWEFVSLGMQQVAE